MTQNKDTRITATTQDYDKNKYYATLLNNKVTNQLSAIYLQNEPVFKALEEQYIKYPRGLTLCFNQEHITNLPISTHKLHDALMLKLTQQIDHRQKEEYTNSQTRVGLPLREYILMIGKDPNNETTLTNIRRQVNNDLYILRHLELRIDWDDTNKHLKKPTDNSDYYDLSIITQKGIENSIIYATFDTDYIKHIAKCGGISAYPLNLFKVPTDKTPLPYIIGKKLSTHHSLNNNQKTGTANIIKVKTLIQWLTDFKALQSEEQLKAQNQRNYYRIIIEPIEKALEVLKDCEVITSWAYTEKNGQYIKDPNDTTNYKTVKEKYILFTMPGDPELIENKNGIALVKQQKPFKIKKD